MDLVRQLLMSCGMSCTVHKIAPVVMGDKIMVWETRANYSKPDLWFQICSRPMRSRALIMSGGEQYELKENQYTLDLNFEELVKVC